MSYIKSLLGDSLVYGVGSFLLKATQIFVLPIILFYLKKEQFGELDFFLNIKNILVVVYGWGILTSIFKYTSDLKSKDSAPFNGFLVVLAISVIVFTIFFILVLFIPSLTKYLVNILFVQIIAFFAAILTIPLGILRHKRRPKTYIFINLMYTLTLLVVSYILISKTSMNYRAILWGHSVAAIFAVAVSFFVVKNFVRFKFNISVFKQMFSFGFSILLNSLSFVFIFGSTRFVLKLIGSFEDIGILGMAQRLSLFVGALLISPFTLAWLPFVNSIRNKVEFSYVINRVFTIFVWVGLLFCFSLEFLQRDFFLLIKNNEYIESAKFVLPFSLSYFFQGLYFIFSAGIFLKGDNKAYRIIGVFGPLFNLLLYGIFFKILSLEVIGLITLLSFVFTAFLAFFYGNDIMKVKIFNKRNFVIFILYTGLIFFAKFLPEYSVFSIFYFSIKIFFIISLIVTHIYIEKNRNEEVLYLFRR